MLKRLHLIFLSLVLSISAFGQFETVGIIGDATPNGWDASTPMVQDPVDTNIWTLEVELFEGEAKFRADDDWAVNWGSTSFPIGVGENDGPNIPIEPGFYEITFNSETGEYFFDFDGTIGIIGSATPFGWDRDVFMFPDAENPGTFNVTLDLVAGEAKFRANGDWELNWGGEGFPTDTAEVDGSNIPVDAAGTYEITFDTVSRVYNFESIVGYDSISIIGSATPGGWDEDTPLQRDANDPDLWSATVELTEGELKFRAENDWAVNWGADTFPVGTAVPEGENIMVDSAGTYIVNFNTSTLDFEFVLAVEYDVVSVIGDAAQGWDTDVNMQKDPEDPFQWSLRTELNQGEFKFRANNDWAVNWGSGDFPSGVAIINGPNIPVSEAGEYFINFNTATGEYEAEEIIEYNAMGIVGKSGPFGAWPNLDEHDPGARDVFMEKDPEDGNVWRYSGIELVDYDPDNDGGLKFRADTAWTVNWGAEDFPEGVGVNDGPNIQPVAGTYDVVFDASTGEYIFASSTSAENVTLSLDDISLMPNPATNRLIVNLDEEMISGGKVEMNLFSTSGQIVLTKRVKAAPQIELQVSGLNPGLYILNIQQDGLFASKKLTIVR